MTKVTDWSTQHEIRMIGIDVDKIFSIAYFVAALQVFMIILMVFICVVNCDMRDELKRHHAVVEKAYEWSEIKKEENK